MVENSPRHRSYFAPHEKRMKQVLWFENEATHPNRAAVTPGTPRSVRFNVSVSLRPPRRTRRRPRGFEPPSHCVCVWDNGCWSQPELDVSRPMKEIPWRGSSTRAHSWTSPTTESSAFTRRSAFAACRKSSTPPSAPGSTQRWPTHSSVPNSCAPWLPGARQALSGSRSTRSRNSVGKVDEGMLRAGRRSSD